MQGTTKEDIAVTKNEGEKHKVTVQVEDEAKAKLKITKKEQGTDNVIKGIKYKLTGADRYSDRVRTILSGSIQKISRRWRQIPCKCTGWNVQADTWKAWRFAYSPGSMNRTYTRRNRTEKKAEKIFSRSRKNLSRFKNSQRRIRENEIRWQLD